MCFSAGASFSAGVLLSFIGTETVKKVHKPSQAVFAAIPIFFALQQFAEGILWLAIGRSGYAGVEMITTYIFIIMAQIIWPVMIPLSVILIEENKLRKKILYVLLAAGIAVGVSNIYGLIFHGIHAEVSGYHLTYANNTPLSFDKIGLLLYLTVTTVPLFVSSVKRMYILGIIMVLSFAVSAVFYMKCLTSVWCFFAAVISFVIFYIIRDSHKKFHMSPAK